MPALSFETPIYVHIQSCTSDGDGKAKEGRSANAASMARASEHIVHTTETAYAAPDNMISKKIDDQNTQSTSFAAKANDFEKYIWYVDSEASNHMTPYDQLFKDRGPSNVHEIRSANDAKMKVNDAGEAALNKYCRKEDASQQCTACAESFGEFVFEGTYGEQR